MPASRKDLLPQARALYVQGMTTLDIADGIGVSAATVRRWKADDRKAGHSWEAARAEDRRKNPHALLEIVERRLEGIAADDDLDANAWADALYKVNRVVESIRSRIGDVSTVMGVLTDLAEWAATNAKPEHMPAVRAVMQNYISHLKRSNK